MDTKKKIAMMHIAFTLSELSHARRKKVGCLIVKQHKSGFHQIISDGVNGMRPGLPNQCEDTLGNTRPDCRHAERNALCKLSELGIHPWGAVMYVTHQPCADCANRIIDSGITTVYYCLPYKDVSGLDTLIRNGVEVCHVQPDVMCTSLHIQQSKDNLSLLEHYDASAALRIKLLNDDSTKNMSKTQLEEVVSSYFAPPEANL